MRATGQLAGLGVARASGARARLRARGDQRLPLLPIAHEVVYAAALAVLFTVIGIACFLGGLLALPFR